MHEIASALADIGQWSIVLVIAICAVAAVRLNDTKEK